jgi:DNA-binding GntR family transcriptional regulator
LDTINGKKSSPGAFIKKAIPVSERTYEYLRSRVLSGGFNPGDRLTEEHLAEELGVSRTPIREALHKLELEGLIKSLETRGFIIPRESNEEVEELFDLRAVLEGYTLRLICERISEETLKQLDGYIEKGEDALKRKKLDEVCKWNTKFHDTLHGLVRNRNRLHRILVNIRKYVLRYRRNTLQYLDAGNRRIDGHRKIMLALRLKDPDLCERLMREHIREAKEEALQTLLGKAERKQTEEKNFEGVKRRSNRLKKA